MSEEIIRESIVRDSEDDKTMEEKRKKEQEALKERATHRKELKNKMRKAALIVGSIAVVGFGFSVADRKTEWTDPVMEEMVRVWLNKPEGDIWKSEIEDITNIAIVGPYLIDVDQNEESGRYEITYATKDNFAPIEPQTARRMDEIDYSWDINQVSINDELYTCSNRQEVISDWSDVQNFENLESLSIMYYRIENGDQLLKCLSEYTDLKNLSIYGGVMHYTSLEGMTKIRNLEYLNFSPQWSEIDLSFLTNMNSLKYLTIGHLAVRGGTESIRFISECTNLRQLTVAAKFSYVQGDGYSAYLPLSGFKNLTHLNLAYSNLEVSTEELRNLDKLTSLGINVTPDNKDLGYALQNLTNLKELLLTGYIQEEEQKNLVLIPDTLEYYALIYGNFREEGLHSVAHLTNLKTLILGRSQRIRELQELSKLQELESFHVVPGADAVVTSPHWDLEPLTNCEKLKNLSLYRVVLETEDLEVISSFPQLTNLWLQRNHLTNIEPLRDAPSLQSVIIYANDIEDYSPIDQVEDVVIGEKDQNRSMTR